MRVARPLRTCAMRERARGEPRRVRVSWAGGREAWPRREATGRWSAACAHGRRPGRGGSVHTAGERRFGERRFGHAACAGLRVERGEREEHVHFVSVCGTRGVRCRDGKRARCLLCEL
eukprot:4117598-Prymnesium_polylepis.2